MSRTIPRSSSNEHARRAPASPSSRSTRVVAASTRCEDASLAERSSRKSCSARSLASLDLEASARNAVVCFVRAAVAAFASRLCSLASALALHASSLAARADLSAFVAFSSASLMRAIAACSGSEAGTSAAAACEKRHVSP
jgi:hypothetical protein